MPRVHLVKRAHRKIVTPLLWNYTSAECQCATPSFSQFGEDVMCSYLFKDGFRGFYVDVGAFHPMLLSNTYLFHRRGWRGIAIDASPDVAELFARFRPSDEFLHLAVGTQSGEVELALFKESTFNCIADHIQEVPEPLRSTARFVKVPIQPLSSIFESRGVEKIDFLNVDCEGNDLNVLESNNWTRWKPSVVCVEDHAEDWQRSEIVQFLRNWGYELKFRAVFSSIFLLRDETGPSPQSRGCVPLL